MRLIGYSYPTSRIAPALSFNRSPWSGLDSEIDRLFETTFTGLGRDAARSFPVDLYQDEANTYVRAELPGVSRENIEVEAVGGELTITAHFRNSKNSKAAAKDAANANGDSSPAKNDDRCESECAVSRTVSIPEGSPTDKVSAAYENGVLTVTLPKPEAAKPRKVAIQVG